MMIGVERFWRMSARSCPLEEDHHSWLSLCPYIAVVIIHCLRHATLEQDETYNVGSRLSLDMGLMRLLASRKASQRRFIPKLA